MTESKSASEMLKTTIYRKEVDELRKVMEDASIYSTSFDKDMAQIEVSFPSKLGQLSKEDKVLVVSAAIRILFYAHSHGNTESVTAKLMDLIDALHEKQISFLSQAFTGSKHQPFEFPGIFEYHDSGYPSIAGRTIKKIT